MNKNLLIFILVLTIASYKIIKTEAFFILALIELVNNAQTIEGFVETLITLTYPKTQEMNGFTSKDPYTKDILAIAQDIEQNTGPLISVRITAGKINDLIKHINRLHETFVTFKNKTDVDKEVIKFVEVVLDYDKAVDIESREIFEYTVVCGELQLETCLIDDLKQLIEYLIPNKKQQTPQQYFYHIYLLLMQTHSKAFQMTDYAFKIIHNNTNKFLDFVSINEATWRLNSIHRMNETVNIFKNLLKTLPRDIWAADRDNLEEDKTYFELHNVFSRILYDGADFEKKDWSTCPAKCPKINDINYVAQCHREKNDHCFVKQKICNQIAECKVFDKKEYYKVWPAKNTTFRRYDTIEISHLDFNEKPQTEYAHIGNYVKKVGVTRFSSGYDITCVACKCICYEPKNSDRYFSLREVMADTHKNFVVTGIRFRKVNNEVNLQIQQGKLIENGFIDQDTVDWKKIVTKDDVDPKNQEIFSSQRFTLEWHNSRGLILDDIEVPKGHVVVGVTLYQISIGDDKHLQLVLYSASFDVITGNLTSSNRLYFQNFDRYYWNIENYDKSVPIPYTIDFRQQKDYIRTHFTTTGLTTTDAGQSTIPFIDMQDVISKPATPLSGISMLLEAYNDKLGFLKLKLTTFDVFNLI